MFVKVPSQSKTKRICVAAVTTVLWHKAKKGIIQGTENGKGWVTNKTTANEDAIHFSLTYYVHNGLESLW